MGPQKQCDFMMKERVFHLVQAYLFPLPDYFFYIVFTLPQFPW